MGGFRRKRLPSRRPPLLRVGLTGGIACGKSTISRHLAQRGAFVVDMDRVAHEVMEPDGAAYESVVALFGSDILDADGRIDRQRLGPIVFADPAARQELEAVVHPAVRLETTRRIQSWYAAGDGSIAVVDAALLVETGQHGSFDRLIVVTCSRQTQISRIRERDGWSIDEAERRIDAQLPLERKVAVADYVIDTDQPLETCLAQADTVWGKLLDVAARSDVRQGLEAAVQTP